MPRRSVNLVRIGAGFVIRPHAPVISILGQSCHDLPQTNLASDSFIAFQQGPNFIPSEGRADALADDANLAIVGLIHHNKSSTTDPLNLVMASKAFTAVARSVHTIIRDPEDESGLARLLRRSKNNLGSTDLPVLRFVIDSHTLPTQDGPASG